MKRTSAENYSRQQARKLVKEVHPFIRPDQHVHHIDGNPFNNSLENLCVLPNGFHSSLHHLGRKYPERPKKPVNLKTALAYLERKLFFYNNCIWF